MMKLVMTIFNARCLTNLFLCALLFGAHLLAVQAPDAQQTSSAPPKEEQAAERKRIAQERMQNDWANLSKYREDNAKLGAPGAGQNRVVFMGDSITEGWGQSFAVLFPGKPYINRGISGQTTPQMLVRFRSDVIALAPKAVVILAGTNDIAGNTGPMTLEMTENNLMSMVEMAKANKISVILCSVLPAYDFPWKPGLQPAEKIVALNAWIKDYAAKNGLAYVDYHSAMADERRGLKTDLSGDGVHPNQAGYALMTPLVEKAIAQTLNAKK